MTAFTATYSPSSRTGTAVPPSAVLIVSPSDVIARAGDTVTLAGIPSHSTARLFCSEGPSLFDNFTSGELVTNGQSLVVAAGASGIYTLRLEPEGYEGASSPFYVNATMATCVDTSVLRFTPSSSVLQGDSVFFDPEGVGGLTWLSSGKSPNLFAVEVKEGLVWLRVAFNASGNYTVQFVAGGEVLYAGSLQVRHQPKAVTVRYDASTNTLVCTPTAYVNRGDTILLADLPPGDATPTLTWTDGNLFDGYTSATNKVEVSSLSKFTVSSFAEPGPVKLELWFDGGPGPQTPRTAVGTLEPTGQ
jgi:hypothetical protein